MGKSFAILGMGRFGKKLALCLYDFGADVMAVDNNPEQLEKVSGSVTYAIQADLRDPDDIKGIGLENTDVVVVAMGSDLTASIMSVMVSKELGVPYVMAKAADERMGSVLTKVGADKVIYPEEETGIRTARILTSESFLDFFEIDDNLCVLEIQPKKEWIGKNLLELKLRDKYKMNVVAVKSDGKMHSVIDPNIPIEEDNAMLVVLDRSNLKKLG